MKRVIVVFLLFIFSSFTSSLIAETNPKALNEIFAPYINMIDEHTDANVFLKDWNLLEYLTLFEKLNYSFTVAQDIPSTIEEYSSETYQQYALRRSITSVLMEILGGVYLKSEIEDTASFYYIPGSLLDPGYMIDKTISDKLYDGALVKIKGDEIVISKIIDAKSGSSAYDLQQIQGVLDRWKKSGIYISKKLFTPDSIKIKIATGVLPVKNCSLENFSSIIIPLNVENIESIGVISENEIQRLSDDLFYSLYSKKVSSILEKISIDLVNRVLFLLKKYIQIYHKIPSLMPNINFNVIQEKVDNDPDYEYYVSYFRNKKHRIDLTVSLYLIYNSNFLYSIFAENIGNFFEKEDVKLFYSTVNQQDPFTNVYRKLNNLETIVNTLTVLLGTQYRERLNEYVYANRNLMLIGVFKNYDKGLLDKFDYLKRYMSVKTAQDIILNNLKHFIIIKPNDIKFNMGALYYFFKKEDSEDRLAEILNQYFYRILTTKFEILEKNIDFISKTFMDSNNQYKRVQALELVLENRLELMTSEVRANIRSIYNFLQQYKNIYFPSMNEYQLREFCRENINSLVYLKRDNLIEISNILYHSFKIKNADKERIFISNFKDLHKIEIKELYEKISFVRNFLNNNGYTDKNLIDILETRLYHISCISQRDAGLILRYFIGFLGASYKSSTYRWLVESDEDFKNLDVEVIKEAVNFLKTKIRSNDVVKDIVANLKNLKCLHSAFLELVMNAIFVRIKDSDEGLDCIRELLQNKFLDLDEIFSILSSRKNIYFLNKQEKSIYINQQIEQWIDSGIRKYLEQKGDACKKLFTLPNTATN